MQWLNVNLFDTLERVKGFFLTWLMLPVKRFFVGIPWGWGVLVTAVAVGRIGGARLGLMAGAMVLFVAANGFWDEAMVTLYLISVSVLVASAVGIPLGLWAGQRPARGLGGRGADGHVADAAELRLPDSGGHAVPRR